MHTDFWEYLYLPCVGGVFIASFVNIWRRRKSYFFSKTGPVTQRNYSSWLINEHIASFRPNINMPPAENSLGNEWFLNDFSKGLMKICVHIYDRFIDVKYNFSHETFIFARQCLPCNPKALSEILFLKYRKLAHVAAEKLSVKGESWYQNVNFPRGSLLPYSH